MRIYLSFTIAASKMFFRRKSSIFWSLFFPVVTMLVLGNAGFIGYSAPNVGLFSTTANEIIDELKSSKSITIREYQSKDNALEALEKGTLSALITLNPDSKFIVTTRDGDLAEKEVVENFVFRIINQDIDPINNVSSDIAKMNYQGYKGFIVPGIAAMAIMQNGIFSVVFTLLSYKNQGVLKRLKAAPISPSHFIVGHLISRVSIIILQTFILLIMGVFVLGVSVGQGSFLAWLNILFLSFLGGILFLAIGLAISSLAPNEDSAPALANLVTFPMLFLSGVFFPIDFLPKIISYISNILPLTHLAEGIRLSALYGNSTFSTIPQLGITLAWLALSFFICAISFKWE
ncbi:MAG: ABC transporter permease [Chloroflexota bacterium]|jgi:ABC-2 type transport system permease protein|nr:ABC transporter permease [Chloroflexota bacterium]MEE2620565.1 ABC transporter permease [Chloroflexota bacterium]|tara:strand:+ start:389 stop:1426 length:1038 start_codon:yes stop_codon:yes gene_type:complete